MDGEDCGSPSFCFPSCSPAFSPTKIQGPEGEQKNARHGVDTPAMILRIWLVWRELVFLCFFLPEMIPRLTSGFFVCPRNIPWIACGIQP